MANEEENVLIVEVIDGHTIVNDTVDDDCLITIWLYSVGNLRLD